MSSIKFSVTLPESLFKLIEQDRSKEKLKRSELLQIIVRSFYKKAREKKEVEKYIQAYKRHPESKKEIDTRTMIGLESFNKEEW